MKKLGLIMVFSLCGALSAVPARGGELHNAAYRGDLKQIKALLAQGADIAAHDEMDQTPLHVAIDAGHPEAAQLLLDRGAKINAPGTLEWTPLYEALQRVHVLTLCKECQITPGRRAVISLLVSRGGMPGPQGWNCIAHYSPEAIRIIIDSLPDGAITTLPPGWGEPWDLVLQASLGNIPRALTDDILRKITPALRKQKLQETAATLNQESFLKDGRPNYPGAPPSSPDDQMVTTMYRVATLRNAAIFLAQSLSSPPTVAETAKRRFAEGNAAFKTARNDNDYREAKQLFRQGSALAPWWPNPYYNLALVEEKLANPREALRNYQFYLEAAPNADDAEKVRSKTYELEYLIKRGAR